MHNEQYMAYPIQTNLPLYNSPLWIGYSPKFCDLIFELSVKHQVSESMTIVSTIVALSTAIQGLVDVEMPTGKIVPVSMMAFVIAESGERKSTIENAAMSEIREFQKKEQQETTESLKEWEEDYKIWKRTLERLRNTIANMKVEGEDDEIYSARLKTHLTTEPIRPTCFRLLYESTTQEALLQGLDKNYPYASLVSSEGGMLL